MTIVVFSLIHQQDFSVTGMNQNECLNKTINKCFFLNETNVSNFNPLEVVSRVSETQLQVGEKF